MKYKITPLLIVSIGIIIYGMVYFYAGMGGNLGPLFSFILVIGGVLVLGIYFVSKRIFASNYWQQILVESIFLSIVCFSYYRSHERTLLHIPKDFQGYIVVVYGVDNAPKIKNNSFYSPNSNFTLPNNGIILTSSKHSVNIRIVDISEGGKKILEPGYGFSCVHDTLKYRNDVKSIEIIYYEKEKTNWSYDSPSDKANRILKKDLVRKLLSESFKV